MEEQQINTNKSELWNLSFKDLFYKYVRFLPLFLLSVAIALLIAFVYLRYTTRIYSAGGTMLINNEQTSARTDKVEDILAGNNRSQNIQNDIEVLKSRPLMARVVQKLKLQFSYTAKGKIKDFNIYKQGPFIMEAFSMEDSLAGFSLKIKFINDHQFRINNEPAIFATGDLFKNPYGVFRLVKKAPAVAGSEYIITWQPVANVASALAGGVRVQPKVPGTSILSISIQSTNAQMAADIVNSLMIEYDSMTVEQNNYSTDQMLGFIDERLNILNHELDTLQLKFLKYKQDNNLFDVDKQVGEYFSKYTEADKTAIEEQFKLEVADDIDAYLKDKKNLYSKVTPSAFGLEDITLNELIGLYNKMQLDRQALLDANVPAENPAVKEAEGQIEKIREKLLENLRTMRLSLNSAINMLRSRSGNEQSKLQSLPYKLKLYVEMERQINTKLALYNLLEGKERKLLLAGPLPFLIQRL